MTTLARLLRKGFVLGIVVALLLTAATPRVFAYTFNYTVADMRQSASQSGGTSCPQRNRFSTAFSGGINRTWSTSLNTSSVTILTLAQSPSGRLSEIENVIQEAFAVWTGVANTSLMPAALAPLAQTSAQNACTADGRNTICFDQNDPAFTAGVLAFNRVLTADTIGAQPFPGIPPASFVGQILDADTLLQPNDGRNAFATPQALPNFPNGYDLESILTHELGHFFGFGHSGVWRAMMDPVAPPRGQFLGSRPTQQQPDAPLADDDRTGLRVLYPDSSDTLHVGSIAGQILPANPRALAAQPAGVTGIFGAQVVAVENATGKVVAAVLAGWSCADPGPVQFDGFYLIERLPVGASQSYRIYVEPLDGPVGAAEMSSTTAGLCRNPLSDPGWPLQFACQVPPVYTNFTTRVRPQ